MNTRYMIKRITFFGIIFLSFISLRFVGNGIVEENMENNVPTIDGKIGNNEWINGDRRTFSMADGSLIETVILFNETHVFVLFKTMDDDPTLFGEDDYWDVFGVEFDSNRDQVPMGMETSPDDALFISYSKNEGQDFFLQGMGNPALEDTANGGTNDVVGSISFEGNELIAEACKKLDSGDKAGEDISLKPGDNFYVMYAYWDNKDPHTQTTSHSNWKEYSIPNVNGNINDINTLIPQIIIEIILSAFFVIFAGVLRFRSSNVLNSSKQS